MPIRVQLSRKKGWRMPPDTVNVARPTKWGNPYWLEQKFYGLDFCLKLFADTARGIWKPSNFDSVPRHVLPISYEHHCAWVRRIGCNPVDAMRVELRDKNLACWCALDKQCHADILLKIANE